MTDEELKLKVRELIDSCGPERNQQAIKSVLLGMLAAMCSHREMELMNHAAKFSQSEVMRLSANRT